MDSMTNFVAIFPHDNMGKIKEVFDSLKLHDYETHIIIVEDGMDEEDLASNISFVNNNLLYSGYLSHSKYHELTDRMHRMGAKHGDALFVIRQGNSYRYNIER